MPRLALPGRTLDLDALVFDKDGVLIDFHSFWGALTRERVRALGFEPERDAADFAAAEALLGLGGGQVDPEGPLMMATRQDSATLAAGLLYTRRHVPWVEARRRAADAFDRAEERVPADLLQACPGALAATEELARTGWRLAVATTDARDHALRTLAGAGYGDRFEAVVGADEVARGKPDPEMYLLACDRLGVRPERTAVVGDGVHDLEMGRAAGCAATIGVLSGVGDRAALAPAADLLVAGVRDLPALCK